jgi:adenylate cyclase class 2
MRIEIEKRYKLADASKLRELLRSKGAVAESQTRQVDTYFNAPHRDFLMPEVITEWLRVRSEDGRASVTFKKWKDDAPGSVPYCNELETMVSDGRAIADLFQELGFVKLVTVDKLREVWRLDLGVRVCIDNVTDLGSFVEFESLAMSSALDAAMKQIETIANECMNLLGERDIRGYPYHLLGREA